MLAAVDARGARSSARPPGGTSGIVSVGAVRATHLRQRALRGAGRGDRPRVDEGGGDLAGHRRRLELSDGAGQAGDATVHRLSPAGQSARLPHRDRKASRRVRHRRDTDDLVYEVRTSGCTSPTVTASSTYMTKQRPVHPCRAPPRPPLVPARPSMCRSRTASIWRSRIAAADTPGCGSTTIVERDSRNACNRDAASYAKVMPMQSPTKRM